ncbi:hypothetical protein IMZ48_09880 [Candidatus Bathyarchaeota archaeon]|nr:hypothetical protein [Candidatus Bathyarchaeota archaeon]
MFPPRVSTTYPEVYYSTYDTDSILSRPINVETRHGPYYVAPQDQGGIPYAAPRADSPFLTNSLASLTKIIGSRPGRKQMRTRMSRAGGGTARSPTSGGRDIGRGSKRGGF